MAMISSCNNEKGDSVIPRFGEEEAAGTSEGRARELFGVPTQAGKVWGAHMTTTGIDNE